MAQDNIQFRTIPRSNEKLKPSAEKTAVEVSQSSWGKAYIAVISVPLAALALWAFFPQFLSKTAHKKMQLAPRSVSSSESEEVHGRITASVQRHLSESRMRREMMERKQQMENMKVQNSEEGGTHLADDHSVSLGVPLMDQDKTMERIYGDLDLNSRGYSDVVPHDWINARLANRKWLNEHERAERIQFVRNFILTAYERGYEVQLNENLVVIGVRRLRKDRVVTIDQIMDRLAKQGL